MRIRDIMTAPVVTIAPEATIRTARLELQIHEIRHLVVVAKRRIVGVVSEHDIVGQPDDMPVSYVMSREMVTIEPDSTLRHAAAIMDGRMVGCLPVVKGGELEGIVTSTDLLHAIAKGAIHADQPGERYLLARRGAKRRHSPA